MSKFIVELPQNEVVTFTPIGMHLEQVPSQNVWYEAGRLLKETEDTISLMFKLCWGDWIAHGLERKFESVYSDAMLFTSKGYSTLANWKWIATITPPEHRGYPGLTFHHFQTAAQIVDEEERWTYIKLASERGWSADEMISQYNDSQPENTPEIIPPHQHDFEQTTKLIDQLQATTEDNHKLQRELDKIVQDNVTATEKIIIARDIVLKMIDDHPKVDFSHLLQVLTLQ